MLALIAGEGQLPKIVMDALDRDDIPFRLCEVEGHACAGRAGRPVLRFRVETIGSFIQQLIKFDVDKVCFAGRVVRPSLDPSKLDEATKPLVPRMLAALQAGDDGALRAVLGFFEEAGIEIVAAHNLAPALIPAPGVYSAEKPNKQDEADADRGAEIIRAISGADIGQACIVSGGQALAVETIGGTDRMMRSLLRTQTGLAEKMTETVSGKISDWSDPIGMVADYMSGSDQQPLIRLTRDPALPMKGLLLKAAKSNQDMRVDVPTIGVETVRRAIETDLRGIVIEAGRVMVVDLDHCVKLADEFGLIFWVRD